MRFRTFPKFPAHAISYGAVGTGKSINTKYRAEYFYSKGCKIIDIYDEGRLENCFYFFPNEDKSMFDLRKRRTPTVKEKWEPRGFPTECFIPVNYSIPKRLPSIFKPFKIAFNDLKFTEFVILLGNISLVQREILEWVWNQLPASNRSFSGFISLMKELLSHSSIKVEDKIIDICDDRTGLSILQKLNKLNQLGVIGDKDDEFNLDLKKIMRDRDIITCFSFAFLQDYNARHLISGYLFRKIYTLRINNQYRLFPELVIIHRELQNNAPARGKKSSISYEGQGISLEFIRRIIAEPRDVGVRIIADSQDPFKLDADVRKGFTTYFLFRMDRAVLTPLRTMIWLDDKTERGILSQDMGVFTIKTIPQSYNPHNRYGIQYKATHPAPKSWCKSPYDLFFKIWRDKGLSFNSWNFKRPKSILAIKRLSKGEKKEVQSFKEKSIYDYYFSLLKVVIGENPGISIQELTNNSLVKKMPWGNYSTLKRVIDMMVNESKVIRSKRDGKTWGLTLPA